MVLVTATASLGSLMKSGNFFFPEYVGFQLQVAAQLAHWVLVVHSMSAKNKAFFISCESLSL